MSLIAAGYPTTFAETFEVSPLVDPVLHECGFVVTAGLQREDLSSVQATASQDAVREFCPKDSSDRFASETTAEQWLSKGRGMFLLRQVGSNTLAGYGWTGPETCTEVPGGETTFAIRLNPDFAGQGLGVPFTAAILAGSAALYGSKNAWLETWASNTPAVKTYVRSGADLVTTKDAVRPTLVPSENELQKMRRDVRLYMRFSRFMATTEREQ